MLRKIIHIDQDLCNGCRACVDACHEGAIALVDGKAQLVRDDFCDGLGDCLPACPTGAITFEVREAAAYDEAAVAAASGAAAAPSAGGCPGSRPQSFAAAAHQGGCPGSRSQRMPPAASPATADIPSALSQWPIQIKLLPQNAPYFNDADLLVAADCTAFSLGSFHPQLLAGKTLLIGCPKLDDGDWAEKLTRIIATNDIRSVTVARMEVPCCGGLQRVVEQALAQRGNDVPLDVVTISIRGEVLP